ncbi:MAG TPA: phytoene/squalene synthase family protein [Noviherbaspirillum sp.]|jgi:phytoene synthase|uniref:phytoene/squalene synthase family protein n=1 Tax=Noviherbaspirillum sp. TaxID=1926288 RepID=UPI002F91E016
MTESLEAYSEHSIREGSKSFARAATLFAPEMRRSVMMLYAWCRYCDDVIDGQVLGYGQQQLSKTDKSARLQLLREETARVCDGHGSDIPAFAALAEVLRRHAIPRRYLFELLDGFALDAAETRFTTFDETLHYCYHVAGVVGVMMACIMGVRDPEVLHRAADLGIAFQLTNIARDIREDLQVGRCYLPEQWLDRMGVLPAEAEDARHAAALHALACELVAHAEPYYASARIGLARLPWRCAWAIGSALLIYRDIGLLLRANPASGNRRMQVSDRRKLWRVCGGLALAASARVKARRRAAAPRAGLWTKAGMH